MKQIEEKLVKCHCMLDVAEAKSAATVFVRERKTKRSSLLTDGFREHFLTFQSYLKKLEFHKAKDEAKTILDETDWSGIKSLSTYWHGLMKATVLSADEFRVIDAEEEYALKETVLLLVRNLAFVSFQRHQTLDQKREKECGKMCAAALITKVLQETGEWGTFIPCFVSSVVPGRHMTTMATTESFADK